jgi:hypothetical protein
MPFHPNTQCATCSRIKGGDDKLLDRINRSKQFVAGGEPLTAIAADIGISYESVYNHAKKHQAPTKAKFKRQIRAKETKDALQNIQTATTAKTVAIYSGQADMRRDLLIKAKEALDSGDLKMTMNAFVSLLGQEQKAEENAKDRGLEMMKMFNYFASGAAPSGIALHATPRAAEIPRASAVEGELVD